MFPRGSLALQLSNHPLVRPDLDIEAVEVGPGLIHSAFITFRLELEAVDNGPLIVNGVGDIWPWRDPERRTFVNPGGIFLSPTSASRCPNQQEPILAWIV